MRINCKDCVCWSPDPDAEEQYGTCRMSPPTVINDGHCLWPATAAEDWCASAIEDWDIAIERGLEGRL